MKSICFLFFLPLLLCIVLFTHSVHAQYWWNASRESTGLAPDPTTTPEAVIQVYGARAYSWRGYFGIHTWIAVKPTQANTYTVYEVIGWLQRQKLSVVSIHQNAPDRRWYGNMPEILLEKRGSDAETMIEKIDQAARAYPYSHSYTIWPGPNSNTFVAWISRAVPELRLNLPSTAIGKDYLGLRFFSRAPSGSGYQFSVFGLFGILISPVEGFELNLLGLTFGFSLDPFTIKLPVIGHRNFSPSAPSLSTLNP